MNSKEALCICGQTLDPNGFHAVQCKNNGSRIFRHNALRNQLAAECTNAGLQVKIEQRDLSKIKSKERPGDISVQNWGDQVAFLDVAVTSVTADYQVKQSKSQQGAAAVAYEIKKKQKYSTISPTITYIPMVVESFGTWGPAAIDVFKILARKIAAQRNISYSVSIHQLFQRMSIVRVKQNSQMITSRYKEYSIRSF
jgi:hypothetical protein